MHFPRLRHSVRALIVDPDDRLLLCRVRTPDGVAVWVAPGGGIEDGETKLEALARELREEVGLELDTEPLHVWHSTIVSPDHVAGFDGVVNDFYLVRIAHFTATPGLSADELALEHLSATRWWPIAELTAYAGPDLLGPRSLATDVAKLLAGPLPDRPLDVSPPRPSRVVFMCGPAGAGKSTVARSLEQEGMVRLSFDQEAWERGIRSMPLSPEVHADVAATLRDRLLALVAEGTDVVLDFAFWSRRARAEYRDLLRPLGVEPETIYLATPREVVLERMRGRSAEHGDDFTLTEDLIAEYFDHFEPPTEDEGPLTVLR